MILPLRVDGRLSARQARSRRRLTSLWGTALACGIACGADGGADDVDGPDDAPTGGAGSTSATGGTSPSGGAGSRPAGGSGGSGGGGSGGGGGSTAGGGSGGDGEPLRVELIDGVLHAGVECVLVRTETADYYYDKEGAGLASLVDVSGNDWVSWSRASGHQGEFRGVPNMGPCCHPGYTGAYTSVVEVSDAQVTLRSVADDGSWELRWGFFPDHARLTVTRAPSSYYLLYEGTPGGALGPEDNLGFADGRLVPLAEADFLGDLPDPEWVYFLDAHLGRALLVLHPTDDDVADTYWTYDSMTVFGFGRTCRGGCPGLTRSGDALVLAVTDDTEFSDLAALADRLTTRPPDAGAPSR